MALLKISGSARCVTGGLKLGHLQLIHRVFITWKSVGPPCDSVYHATVISRVKRQDTMTRTRVRVASQFSAPFSISLGTGNIDARACLRRYLLRTVFAGENVLVSQHKRSVVLRFRRSRPFRCRMVAVNLTCKWSSERPFVPPIGPFSGDLRRSEAHARHRADTRFCNSLPSITYPSMYAFGYYAPQPVHTR